MNATTSRAREFANALHEWTPKQKLNADIVRDLCRAIEKDVIDAIPQMPEAWDGHELRLCLAQQFAHQVSITMKTDHHRRRLYNAAIANMHSL